MEPLTDSGSFRDPSGHVFEIDGEIYRTINEPARQYYEQLRDQDYLQSLIKQGWLIATHDVDKSTLPCVFSDTTAYVVGHERIPFISYPYEWGFSALKKAALFHLDFHLKLLVDGFTLTDGTAYNVQFRGTTPVFIDLLSIRPYREGEYWLAHRQFCESFITPLLLRTRWGIPHNGWYRGNLEGIPIDDIYKMLPKTAWLSWNLLFHIIAQAKLQKKTINTSVIDTDNHDIRQTKSPTRPMPLAAYQRMLTGMRKWVAGMQPKGSKDRSVWQDYTTENTYNRVAESTKKTFISQFINREKPAMVWDFGCNTGEYSELAIQRSECRVIGFDIDQNAVDSAFLRAEKHNLPFQPLYFDAANTSPSQGWRQTERKGLSERGNPDALFALAFIHHLAIAKNIPLPQIVHWLLDFADTGVIEFVEKDDPTAAFMLANREDIFDDYTKENFIAILASRATITDKVDVPNTKRTLFSYKITSCQ